MERTHVSPRIPLRIAEAFFRHRWLFLVSLLAVTGVVAAALLLRVKTYVADASTRIVADDDMAERLGVATAKNIWISPAEQNVLLFNDLIKDDLPGGFLDTALRKASLRRPINVDPRANDPRYALLRKRLYASAAGSNLFTIGLTWDDPGECERIAAALQEQYIDEVGLSRQAKAVAATQFLESEIGNYERRMRVAERALTTYKQNNSGQLPEAQQADIDHLGDLRTRLTELRITARDGVLRRHALQKRLAQIRPTSVLERTMGDSPAARMLQEITLRRDLEMVTKLEKHPDVVRLDGQIAVLRQRIQEQSAPPGGARAGSVVTETKFQDNPEYQALMVQLTDADIDQQTRQAQLEMARKQVVEVEARIRRAPAGERLLTGKTRDYDVLKAQYEDLLKQREQAQIKANLDRVMAASTLGRIGIIHAEPTLGKIKVGMMLVGGALLGLVVAAGLVLVSEWMDPTLRDEYDVHRLLGASALAVVPDTAALYAPASEGCQP